jgi:NAD-dependent dihydropyrimidine dehydrogenase PreA subunit
VLYVSVLDGPARVVVQAAVRGEYRPDRVVFLHMTGEPRPDGLPGATFVTDKQLVFGYNDLQGERWSSCMMTDWALPEINLERCDQCGRCIDRCPSDAVEMGSNGPFIARPQDCTYCTDCEAICTQGAITCAFEIVWAK